MINFEIIFNKKNKDYKFYIKNDFMAYSAFYNEQGFLHFASMLNGKIQLTEIDIDENGNGYCLGYLGDEESKIIDLSYFSEDSEIDIELNDGNKYQIQHKQTPIPNGATETVFLSNGSYNKGFYFLDEKNNILYIYRLNPNDINYTENTLDEYLHFQKIYG